MRYPLILASVAALLCGGIQARSQSVTFDFSDGQPDGWANSGFSGSPAATVTNIAGANYIFLPLGGFQVGNVSHGADGSAFYTAMQGAAANPSGYVLSYNWRIDTSTLGASPGTFYQLGAFVNSGSGYYAQDGSIVQLDGTQVASGQVLSGTASITFSAAGFDMPDADTFFRLGIIENADTTTPGVGVQFTDISVTPIPEPSSLALFGLTVPAFWMVRRRVLVRR